MTRRFDCMMPWRRRKATRSARRRCMIFILIRGRTMTAMDCVDQRFIVSANAASMLLRYHGFILTKNATPNPYIWHETPRPDFSVIGRRCRNGFATVVNLKRPLDRCRETAAVVMAAHRATKQSLITSGLQQWAGSYYSDDASSAGIVKSSWAKTSLGSFCAAGAAPSLPCAFERNLKMTKPCRKPISSSPTSTNRQRCVGGMREWLAHGEGN